LRFVKDRLPEKIQLFLLNLRSCTVFAATGTALNYSLISVLIASNRMRHPSAVEYRVERKTDDLRIKEITELVAPVDVLRECAISSSAADTVWQARHEIHRILHGADDRLLVIMGPCSIHDVNAAKEFAARLCQAKTELAADLLLLMRVYFEKPRTTVGWKGLINDPGLDGSYRINDGLRMARRLLLDLNEMGMPAGCEFLDMITPQYVSDLVSWGAIGARTTESQVHRELASGLSCPVGFKNGTDGNIRIAVDAIRAAQAPHHFMAVTKAGRSAIASTTGNEDCHVILRGGKRPNYEAAHVAGAAKSLAEAGIAARIMIDFSHGNSGKDPHRQIDVGQNVAAQIAGGEGSIFGVMIESHLKAGRQDLLPGNELIYGMSITDACAGWEESRALLDILADAVRRRRLKAEQDVEDQ
jgi:3-deoxy-7-phosphoheptulonate synthase